MAQRSDSELAAEGSAAISGSGHEQHGTGKQRQSGPGIIGLAAIGAWRMMTRDP